MNYYLKIATLLLFVWIGLSANAQIEKRLVPYSNKLLINPSYAGLNKDSHFWNSLQFGSQPNGNLNNIWTATYDSWWEQMQGGLSFQFYQGLYGNANINTTGAGFGFSKPFNAGGNKEIIPSFSLSHHIATEQWFVYYIDRIMERKRGQHGNSGKNDFTKYSVTNPVTGLLLNSEFFEIGLSGIFSFYHNYDNEKENFEKIPFIIVFHAVQKNKGLKKGLTSRPVKTKPELTVIYSEAFFLSRAGIWIKQINSEMGLFIQNNYTENNHGIGYTIGKKLKNIQINFSAGGIYSFQNKKAGFFGEITLGLIVPYNHIDKINPWAPVQSNF